MFIPQYFRGEAGHCVSTDGAAIRPEAARIDGRPFSGHAGRGRRGARCLPSPSLCGLHWAFCLAGLSEFQRDICAIAIVTVLTLDLHISKAEWRAAIWTDVLQQTIYVAGTLVGFFTILHLVPGGWDTVRTVAGQAGKFRVFDFSLNLTTTYTFWSGIIGGSISHHGKPRHRPVDCAALAFGAQRAAVEGGA